MPGGDAAVLEDEQDGDGRDAVVAGELGVGIDVDLTDLVVAGEALQGRLHGPARPAPGGPEVHQHRLRRGEHFLFPVVLFQDHGPASFQSRSRAAVEVNQVGNRAADLLLHGSHLVERLDVFV